MRIINTLDFALQSYCKIINLVVSVSDMDMNDMDWSVDRQQQKVCRVKSSVNNFFSAFSFHSTEM